ncbi:sensor histidine kinase [Nocardia alni]|uniref:sensor histidine kinase n=1 Tax=Nocardia alni TaxID=2815723 RepID=UPI001C22E1EF|nr:sensor histidine kinase [Nocardia alni]
MDASTRTTARSVNLLLVTTCVGFSAQPLITARLGHDLGSTLAGIALLAVYAILLAHIVWQGPRTDGDPRKPWPLVICGLLAFGLYLRFGPDLVVLPATFGAAAILLLSTPRAASIVVIDVGLSIYAIRHTADPRTIVDLVARIAIVMTAIYAIGLSVRLAHTVERNRIALDQVATLQERARMARDLHDLLGHSLSAISLKGEIAAKLVHRDPDRAETEINDILALTRRSVGEVRGLAREQRSLSLATEVSGMVSVLEAAGVRCRVDDAPPDLPEQLCNTLGWVVREAGTNILRHSAARNCDISFSADGGTLVMTVMNDGAPLPKASDAVSGTGLAGLAGRVAEAGGTLEFGHTANGGFQVRTVVEL